MSNLKASVVLLIDVQKHLVKSLLEAQPGSDNCLIRNSKGHIGWLEKIDGYSIQDAIDETVDILGLNAMNFDHVSFYPLVGSFLAEAWNIKEGL